MCCQVAEPRNQGAPPMWPSAGVVRLVVCPVTCFSTVTLRTNAGPCSPPSRGTEVGSGIRRRSPPASAADTRSGGRSKPAMRRRRWLCCRISSLTAPRPPRSPRFASHEGAVPRRSCSTAYLVRKKPANVLIYAVPQSCSSDGSVECSAPVEGDLRLARADDRVVHDQHRFADEDDRVRDLGAW